MSENETSFRPDIKHQKSLVDLMDPNRPIPAEYSPLIQGKSIIDVTTSTRPFAKFWITRLDFTRKFDQGSDRDRAQHFLRERLHQQILVDLGGGTVPVRDRNRLSARPMADLAKACGADTYINVDIAHDESLREEDLDGLHIIETSRELLDFVARMKDDSANFSMNGIEAAVGANPAYFRALEQEIVRATRRGGIIFGVESDFAFWEFCEGEKPLLKQVDFKLGGNAFLYEKME